jgi:hypothetical protein
MAQHSEGMRYSEPVFAGELKDFAGNPSSGVYTNLAAYAPPRVFTLASGESAIDQIVKRIELIDNTVVVPFPQSPGAPNRLVLQLHFNTGAADGETGGEDVYGLLPGQLSGKPCIYALKLFGRTVTLTTAGANTVGGGSAGGGRSNGGQFPEQATTLTSTGVIEGLSSGAVEPKVLNDGRMTMVGLADIGPFIAILRCPYGASGGAGVSPLHARWR